MIVADTNLIAYLLIPGDSSELSAQVLRKDSEWIAPLLWRSEFRNVLALYMRNEGMDMRQANATMAKAEELLNNREYAVSSEIVLQFVMGTKLSAYDAEFVALAAEMNIKLITFDQEILSELAQVAVSPQKFLRER